MGFWRGVGRVGKPMVNVSAWINYPMLKDNTHFVLFLFKRYLIPRKPSNTGKPETFAQAAQRLELDDIQIKLRARNFLYAALIFFVVFCSAAAYFFAHILWHGSINAIIINLIVICLSASLAFRYHFWWFQVRTRRLGCTLKQWLTESWFVGGHDEN